MTTLAFRSLTAAGLLVLLAAGCASTTEWTTWRDHPTHFASGDHLTFSVRNTEGASPRVTRTDIMGAREEGWWGKPVTVAQAAIVDR